MKRFSFFKACVALCVAPVAIAKKLSGEPKIVYGRILRLPHVPRKLNLRYVAGVDPYAKEAESRVEVFKIEEGDREMLYRKMAKGEGFDMTEYRPFLNMDSNAAYVPLEFQKIPDFEKFIKDLVNKFGFTL